MADPLAPVAAEADAAATIVQSDVHTAIADLQADIEDIKARATADIAVLWAHKGLEFFAVVIFAAGILLGHVL